MFISYKCTDQSQVQRELSAATVDETKKSLLFNGVARFPLTLLYILLGLAIGAVYMQSIELQALIPHNRFDYLVPQFIIHKLPVGIRAILFSAILAATMSSLDSALNSLSASTMRDFLTKENKLSNKQNLILGKFTTVFWGLIITGFAFIVGNISGTVLESINKIGSAFYGPVLASFLVGVISRRANSLSIFIGVISGVVFNIFLWLVVPEVYWMWWNLFGLAVSVTVTFIVSTFTKKQCQKNIDQYTLVGSGILQHERKWIKVYIGLFFYFIFIIGFMIIINKLFGL